jgi:hypothetical protein
MTAVRSTGIDRRLMGPLAALGPYGTLLLGTVITSAAWGMRSGLMILLAGIALDLARGKAARRPRGASPLREHEAETADSLAKLAAANTGATLAQLPPGFTVFSDLAFSNVNVDHVVVGPSGVWTLETQANPGLVQERAGRVWLNGRPMYRDPRRQARAGAAAVAELLERETGARWWVEGLVMFPNATVQVSRNLPVPRVVGSPQLLSRLRLAPAPLEPQDRERLVMALSQAKEQMAARRLAEPQARKSA